MPRRRRVAVVTGTRAEFGALRSTIAALLATRSLDTRIVACGLHLLRKFGHTARDIERAGFKIDARIPMQRGDDSPTDQALGLARGVAGLARYFERERIDIALVLGDRIEALAGALAAATTGRVVAHIHGGDVALGDFDESVRHAISKLAHIHFAASEAAARRLLRMGESRRRVHVVGAPGLDDLRELLAAGRDERSQPRAKSDEALVVFHPTGRSAAIERRAMISILNAVEKAGLRRRVIYPNSDRGHAGIVAAVESHLRSSAPGTAHGHRSLPRDRYLKALCGARLLIGNSSSGIIEAPIAGTPVVNVGDRQLGRDRGGPAIFDCEETPVALSRAIAAALRSRATSGTAYGNTHSGSAIARTLAAVRCDRAFLRKVLSWGTA